MMNDEEMNHKGTKGTEQEGRRKKQEGRRKKQEGRRKLPQSLIPIPQSLIPNPHSLIPIPYYPLFRVALKRRDVTIRGRVNTPITALRFVEGIARKGPPYLIANDSPIESINTLRMNPICVFIRTNLDY
jgi:hypothetical protein